MIPARNVIGKTVELAVAVVAVAGLVGAMWPAVANAKPTVRSLAGAVRRDHAAVLKLSRQVKTLNRTVGDMAYCFDYKVASLGQNFGNDRNPDMGYVIADTSGDLIGLATALDYSSDADFYALAVNPRCVKSSKGTAPMALKLPLLQFHAQGRSVPHNFLK